jgi:hypothetical protein
MHSPWLALAHESGQLLDVEPEHLADRDEITVVLSD